MNTNNISIGREEPSQCFYFDLCFSRFSLVLIVQRCLRYNVYVLLCRELESVSSELFSVYKMLREKLLMRPT